MDGLTPLYMQLLLPNVLRTAQLKSPIITDGGGRFESIVIAVA
jgi:hypothetical protein